MEQETFYKDQYDKSLDRKNEINSSLSTPIGILTALVAGLFYATTTFDFTDNLSLTIIFAIIGAGSLALLSKSIFHLVKALSDLHEGYDYAYLADTDDLNQYYTGLLNFYNNQQGATAGSAQVSAQKEFDAYLLSELIKSAGINQKNNKAKMFQRFKCHQFMIFAFILLSLLIIPFGVDFGINKRKDKVQKVKIDSVIPVNLNIKCKDTTERLNIKISGNGKASSRKTDPSAHSNDKRGR
jgi:Na+/H+ antiporter NhaC